MSLNKYQQIINKNTDVEVTYDDMSIEIYHRLAYLNFVHEDKDIEEIDKIFHFIEVNGSFFTQLTDNQILADWIRLHLFYLRYEMPSFNQRGVVDQVSSSLLVSALENIINELNMNIISHKMTDNLEKIKNLSVQFHWDIMLAACQDLQLYMEYFDDVDSAIYLFHIIYRQAKQILNQ